MSKIRLIDIVIVILFILSVYFILTRLFGHSATDLTITISLFTFTGGLLYKLNREVGEIKIQMINSFKNVRKDIEEIKISKA